MSSPAPKAGLSLVSKRENAARNPQEGVRGQGESVLPVFRPQASLAEVFGAPRDMSAVGFTLAQLGAMKASSGAILWVQDRMVALETGRPCCDGMARFGVPPERLLLACAAKPADVLWTLEEGLKSTSLAAVVGEVWGDPAALDFTATKRLAMRAEKCGIPAILIRFGGSANLSAARRRWRITTLPSTMHPHDTKAPGMACWWAELFRARSERPGIWQVGYDSAAHRLCLLPASADPALAETGPRPIGRAAG